MNPEYANTANQKPSSATHPNQLIPVSAKPITIGTGFSANSFNHTQFNGVMDPFIMVDHYTMTAPTFGVHPHAGLSAVSLLFEDSQGPFHNRDTLGNNFDLMPGDLYWLNAGTGILHDESPRPGSQIHGLQLFVNMANSRRSQQPNATLIRAHNIPVINGDRRRIRVLLGNYQGCCGAHVPGEEVTFIDARLTPGGDLEFQPEDGNNTWVYTVSGTLSLRHSSTQGNLMAGQAYAIEQSTHPLLLSNPLQSDTQVVLLSGRAINEPFSHAGPFAMRDAESLSQVQARYKQGLFGTIY